MKCDDGTWIRGSRCFGIIKKWEDFHHVPVRSSYQLSFYNVFIVCYLLIESLKKKRPPFLPFLRFPLYVLFGQRDISSSWLYRLVWECMSPKPSFQYFSPFFKKKKKRWKVFVFLIAISSKKEEKIAPSLVFIWFICCVIWLSCTKIAKCLKQTWNIFYILLWEKLQKKRCKLRKLFFLNFECCSHCFKWL